MNRECMICSKWIDVIHGCFIPVLKSDKKLEVTGCESCIKEVVEIARAEKRMSLDETRRLIGLEVE